MSNKQKTGLTTQEVEQAKARYGLNVLTPPPSTPWWKLLLDKFKDPIIIILCVAASISIVVGIIDGNLIEPIGILVAIALATGVGFWMEWSAKKKFDILNQASASEPVKVIRNGETTEVPKDQLVPGDIVILGTGDEVPADLELFESLDLKIDESSMTGESVPASKAIKDREIWEGSGFAPWSALRSTRVMEGSGKGEVVATGDNTEIGKTTRAAQEETDLVTPLQQQLNGLGDLINKAAFTISGVLFILLNIHHFWLQSGTPDTSFMGIFMSELGFLMACVVLCVVSVPEGLPLASTLSLAFSMKTMARENNLVKKMHASETIGAINIIFSDKTGTLTQNSMTVVETHVGKNHTLQDLLDNAAINSTAALDHENKTVGNPSEGAMLRYIRSKDLDWKEIREKANIIDQKPFNSTDKYMSTQVDDIIYVKGAPEIISKMTGTTGFLVIVEDQQARGRRAISCATGKTMDNLKYTGTFFIEDPVRPDVPGAIKTCHQAGIDVIMMTGDNIKTAEEIGRQAGLGNLVDSKIWAIEAKDFKDVVWKNGDSYPNVIARCKPSDKLEILQSFQERGYRCAMTGDGVNDSPSLNHADVGIAMGSGTSVAKEASDIVLLDDAFPSIVTGVKWGRSLYKNIQSFLTFQLTINVATCLTVLFGPILGTDMPFSVTQMLWVNIVMDTLAALCLASEPADPNVLQEKPRSKDAFIITKDMWKIIWGLGITIFVILGLLVWNSSHDSALGIDTDLTQIFAIFMIMNWWNLFNIRVLGKDRSIFYGLKESKNFLIGSLVILIGTILIVQVGGQVFQTHPLGWTEWLTILAVTSPVVIIREVWWRLTHK